MRRWNGWGSDQVDYPVPSTTGQAFSQWIGASQPPTDASLDAILKHVPESMLPAHSLISTEAEDRLRHARGQSLPDWVALRFGRINSFPAGVAYPEGEDDLHDLIQYAKSHGAALIPYGGGTSVAGHINPNPDGPPTISVDMSRMSAMHNLDEKSHLATFGAGIRGPLLEAALRAHGYTLGHYPQSFEYSTLGGWIATRSSGQQSLHYGRIENHFAGGRMITPVGTLEMPPHPASAAGPDLRHMVLGSEGRMGFISEATVRVTRVPEAESFNTIFFRSWQKAADGVREIVQARLPLSMLRLSCPHETETMLTLAGHEKQVNLMHRSLAAMGYQRDEKCMLTIGITGSAGSVRATRRAARAIAMKHKALPIGQSMGRQWAKKRFLTPYLRNTLWTLGYAVDTIETAVNWDEVTPAFASIENAIYTAAERAGQGVHVFTHLSHLYETGASIYTTYIFKILPDPDQMLEVWHGMKHAASQAIIKHGGTISHQHGVGTDHMPYLAAEKGALGISMIANTIHHLDPAGLFNPGKLVCDERSQ